MESIKELRLVCQKPREWCDIWYQRFFSRRVSIYITRLFLKMGIMPNTATAIFLLSILVPCIFFGIGSSLSILAGTLFLQFWYILDHVDGEIARYRKMSSLTGIYFDGVVHYIAHPAVFISLGYGLLRRYGSPCIYLLASSSAISVILINIVLDFKKAVLFDSGRVEDSDENAREAAKKRAVGALLFSLVHKTCIFPHLMNILTIAAILEMLFGVPLVLYAAVYFGIAMPLTWAGKLILTVNRKDLDKHEVSR